MKNLLALCILLLAACTSTGQLQTPPPPSEVNIAATSPATATTAAGTVTVAATASPIPPTTALPCAFVEATKNLPEVSAQIDKAVKELQPVASGRAQTYGENCLDPSNGQSTFHAMESDFYFKINVKNLNDNNELGMWIIKVMKIVEAVPSDSLPGPQPGFVDFTFKASTDQRILHLSINHYKSLTPNINPSDVIPTLFPKP